MAAYYSLQSALLANWDISTGTTLPPETSFLLGDSIPTESLPPLHFEVDWPEGEQPAHFIDHEIPLASARLVAMLKNVGVDNIETFPVVLKNAATGKSWSGYFALNIVGCLEVINMEESKYHKDMEAETAAAGMTFLHFDEIVLDKVKLARHRELLFRIPEDIQIIAHERVVNYLNAHVPLGGWGIEAVEVPVR